MSDSALLSAAQPTTATNLVVQRCVDAYDRIYAPAMAAGKGDFLANRAAAPAFRAAMPELTSPANIRDFIACTARGILLGAIGEKHASKLLYAAQVASGAFRQQAQPQPRHSQSAEDNAAANSQAA